MMSRIKGFDVPSMSSVEGTIDLLWYVIPMQTCYIEMELIIHRNAWRRVIRKDGAVAESGVHVSVVAYCRS